jgi:transcriptional regulator with XRE-family HTH domain
VDVGARLRSLRASQGISLRALAEASGLNVNTLSLIENRRTSPSVGTLQQIASALAVPITAFFEDAAARQDIVIVKHNQGPQAEFAHGIMEDLGGGLAGHGAEPFVITLHPNAHSGDTPIMHTGCEFVYCLEGQLVYWVSQREIRLAPGDSLLFEGRLPHRWANADPTPSLALLVICPDTEYPRASEQHFAAQ